MKEKALSNILYNIGTLSLKRQTRDVPCGHDRDTTGSSRFKLFVMIRKYTYAKYIERR